MDKAPLERALKRSGRKHRTNPVTMLKIILYSAMERKFTSRPIDEACLRDINLILESIIYMEPLRCGYQVTVGKVAEKKIDFVCEMRGEKLYVHVCYLLASKNTIEREFRAYDAIRDNYPKYVRSLDDFDMS